MNIIKFFNQTIDYIETTLEDKIDEKKIVQLSSKSTSGSCSFDVWEHDDIGGASVFYSRACERRLSSLPSRKLGKADAPGLPTQCGRMNDEGRNECMLNKSIDELESED